MPSGQMRSVDAHRFAMVPRADVPRSAFDVEHYHKTTFDASALVPVYLREVLPGDSIACRMDAFVRLATAIVPVMDNLTLESFFFFVPNRLVWTHWEDMMGEKATPTSTTDYLAPVVTVAQSNMSVGSLYDYMGLTLDTATSTDDVAVVSLPFRGYNLIWNEFFRDQDLQTPLDVDTDDGPDDVGDFLVRARGKRHDYFTTCRPWPQKPSNATAFSGLDPLQPGGNMVYPPQSAAGFWSQGAAPVTGLGYTSASTTSAGPAAVKTPGYRTMNYGPYYLDDGLRVQASGTDGQPDVKVLINDIRTATLIQQMLERDARGGTRYAELLRAHFGVLSPDARLQRPEFLGGGRTMVTVHPLAQTSATDIDGSTTALGEQAGIGTASVYRHGFSQSFTEHGFIIGMVNVRADLTYQQGIHRSWYRRGRFEFYWPGLNGLGEQAVQLRELYATGTAAGDDSVFGYQERWSEYKYMPSRVSGAFRSRVATPLDMWHFAEEFAPTPALNSDFVSDPTSSTVQRVLQTDYFGSQQFLGDFLFSDRLVRCMPIYSIPGMGARL